MKNLILRNGGFVWPRMKCLSIPITEQVSASFVLRSWWVVATYHWYPSDQHICLRLWDFEISFSNSEHDSPHFTFGPLHIKVLNGLPFCEFGEKFEFRKSPTPWKDCFVWEANLRVMEIYYRPAWTLKARDYWEEMRRKYIKKPDVVST